MSEAMEHSDILQTAADNLLDQIEGLQIDRETLQQREILLREVIRSRFLPIALYLIDTGHNFKENTHTPQALIHEVITRKDDLGLSPELITNLQQRYGNEVDWNQEALHISNPTAPHPLRELDETVTSHLKEDAKTALAKIAMRG